MMLELILTVCLLAHPGQCERVFVPFQERMSLIECLRDGQLHAADWVRQHPRYGVQRWTCSLPRA